MKFYFSTIADFNYDDSGFSDSFRTVDTALTEGTGIELSEMCLSAEMDRDPGNLLWYMEEKARMVPDVIFHAPYNELTPAAIEPAVLRLTRSYLDAAYEEAEKLGAKKMVVHSGNVPTIYYPGWFIDRSVEFWKNFLDAHPSDMIICMENVLDQGPETMLQVLLQVGDPRLRFCFDAGHALVNSDTESVYRWVDAWGSRISHFHLHNNHGKFDTHNVPEDGLLDLSRILHMLEKYVPDLTVTLECTDIAGCVTWLKDHRLLES